MAPVVHASRILVSRWSQKIWTPYRATQATTAILRDGLRRRYCVRGSIAERRTFSLLRWSCMRYVASGFTVAEMFTFPLLFIIQVFAGAVPFSGKPSSAATVDIMNGVRPPQPKYPTFTKELWLLMQRCWDQDPHLRPRISEALELLLTLSAPPLFSNDAIFTLANASCIATSRSRRGQ